MALTAKFIFDFTNFSQAVDKAQAELKSFESGAGKVQQALDRMANSLSGQKLLQDATLMAKAVEQIGGVSKLTQAELQRVGAQATEAIAKMNALGIAVPQNLQQIADAAKATQKPLEDMSASATKSQSALGSLGASFTHLVAGVASGELIADMFKKIGETIFELGVKALEVLPHIVEQTIALGNSLFEMSLKTGASVENLSKLRYVASQTGIEFSSFSGIFFKMEQNLGASGKKAEELQGKLSKLGLDLKDLKNDKPDEAFIKVMEALEKIPNRAEQASIGAKLFGKGFKEMAGLTQESIKDLMDEAEHLGLVMTTENAAAAHAAEAGWKRFQMQIEAASMSIGNAFVPAVTTVINLMSEGFMKAMKSAGVSSKDLQEIVGSLVTSIAFGFADLLKITAKVADALVQFFGGDYILKNLAVIDVVGRLGSKLAAVGEAIAILTNDKRLLSLMQNLHQEFTDLSHSAEQTAASTIGVTAGLHTLALGVEGAATNIKTGWAEAMKSTNEQIAHFAQMSHDAFGGAGDDVDDVGEKTKKAKKSFEDLYAATRPIPEILNEINGEALEGARYFLAHGRSVEEVATYYGLAKYQVEAINSDLKFQEGVVAATNKVFKNFGEVTIPTLVSQQQQLEYALQGLTEEGLIPLADGFDIAAAHAKALEDQQKRNIATAQALAAQLEKSGMGAGVIMPNVQPSGTIAGADDSTERAEKNAKRVSAALNEVSGILSQVNNKWAEMGAIAARVGADIASGNWVAAIGDAVNGAIDLISKLTGPSKLELEGRKVEAAFEQQFKSFDDMLQKIAQSYELTGKTAAQARRDVTALMNAERMGGDAVQKVIDKINQSLTITDAIADAGYKTNAQLQQAADQTRQIFDTMLASGQFNQDQLNKAYKAMQQAMADAGDAAAAAWLKAQDDAEKGADKVKKALDDLQKKRDDLAQQVAQEAPEEVMGVIETQMRGQMAALDAQIKAAHESSAQASEAAMNEATSNIDKRATDTYNGMGVKIDKVFVDTAKKSEETMSGAAASMADDFSKQADAAAKAIAAEFASLKIHVPIVWDVPPLPGPTTLTARPMAQGGFGFADRPMLFSTQGNEYFAFSGEGKTFATMVQHPTDGGSSVSLDDLTRLLTQRDDLHIASLRRVLRDAQMSSV